MQNGGGRGGTIIYEENISPSLHGLVPLSRKKRRENKTNIFPGVLRPW